MEISLCPLRGQNGPIKNYKLADHKFKLADPKPVVLNAITA